MKLHLSRRGLLRVPFAFGLLLSMALVMGCSKTESKPDADAGLLPEAIAVRKAFESSGPSYRNPVKEMLSLVKAGAANPHAYAEALPQLTVLASNPTISSEQKQAVETLIQRLKTELAGNKKP